MHLYVYKFQYQLALCTLRIALFSLQFLQLSQVVNHRQYSYRIEIIDLLEKHTMFELSFS